MGNEQNNEQFVAVCASVERQDLVRQFVKSWRSVTPEPRPELVIVASGDDDGTVGWCENQNLTVIRSAEVICFAKAYNLGVKAAIEKVPTAEWILLFNNDLILQPGMWDGLAEMQAAHYDIIGAKLLYPPENHPHAGQIQHCGKWLTLDFYPFHVFRFQPADHPQSMMPHSFPLVTFACVAIRREVWDALNGLDEGFVNGYEDDDFCLRAREQGAEIGVHPAFAAIHFESQTSGRDDASKTEQWQKFKVRWIDTGRISWPTGIHIGWKFA